MIGYLSEGVLLVNPMNRVIYINQTAGELLGYEYAGLLGEPVQEVFRDYDFINKIDQISQQLESWSSRGINVVSIGEAHYPKRLQRIHQAPLFLFHKGDLTDDINKKPALAIVGSRAADLTGCKIARDFARELAQKGVCIVSGLALGIDSAAHLGALESGVPASTIAVLGNGLNTIYPSRNFSLARDILSQDGVLLSQYPVDEKPFPSNFLERNRIIAGLADTVVVIQAAQRSGSLATANYALDGDKNVAAVPGCINNPLYKGSNKLLAKGAYVIREVEDLLDIIPGVSIFDVCSLDQQEPEKIPSNLSEQQRNIIKLLKKEENLHYGSFAAYSTDPSGFAREVLELELRGLIKRLPGNYLQLA